jgi:hypothetical protein
MNSGRILWIGAGVVLASVLDLVYMFWSRSQAGGRFNKAIWNSSGLGRGRFNIMGAARHMGNRGYR